MLTHYDSDNTDDKYFDTEIFADEIWLHIFQYLSTLDSIKTRGVNKNFFGIITNSVLKIKNILYPPEHYKAARAHLYWNHFLNKQKMGLPDQALHYGNKAAFDEYLNFLAAHCKKNLGVFINARLFETFMRFYIRLLNKRNYSFNLNDEMTGNILTIMHAVANETRLYNETTFIFLSNTMHSLFSSNKSSSERIKEFQSICNDVYYTLNRQFGSRDAYDYNYYVKMESYNAYLDLFVSFISYRSKHNPKAFRANEPDGIFNIKLKINNVDYRMPRALAKNYWHLILHAIYTDNDYSITPKIIDNFIRTFRSYKIVPKLQTIKLLLTQNLTPEASLVLLDAKACATNDNDQILSSYFEVVCYYKEHTFNDISYEKLKNHAIRELKSFAVEEFNKSGGHLRDPRPYGLQGYVTSVFNPFNFFKQPVKEDCDIRAHLFYGILARDNKFLDIAINKNPKMTLDTLKQHHELFKKYKSLYRGKYQYIVDKLTSHLDNSADNKILKQLKPSVISDIPRSGI